MRVLSPEELRSKKGIAYHPAHVRKLVLAGLFPKPIKLGLQRIAYLEDEIDAWLEQKRADRDAQDAA